MSRRAIAILYGLVTHALFAAGVGWMIVELFDGLQDGLGSGPAWARIAVDVVLVLQFPLLHSFLLGRHGASWLRRLAPRAHAADLATTTFAAVASLQILVAFGLWAPSGVVWWRPEGAALWAWSAAYVASWLFLLVAITQAGLSVQTGALGWTAVFRGLRPRFRPFPRTGLFGRMRHPVYLGFALTLWTGPVWTPDRVVLALGWTAYCVFGPVSRSVATSGATATRMPPTSCACRSGSRAAAPGPCLPRPTVDLPDLFCRWTRPGRHRGQDLPSFDGRARPHGGDP